MAELTISGIEMLPLWARTPFEEYIPKMHGGDSVQTIGVSLKKVLKINRNVRIVLYWSETHCEPTLLNDGHIDIMCVVAIVGDTVIPGNTWDWCIIDIRKSSDGQSVIPLCKEPEEKHEFVLDRWLSLKPENYAWLLEG